MKTPAPKTKTAAQSKKAKAGSMPPGMHTVTPHLVCAGAADAIAFYQRAFGATEVRRVRAPDGKLLHAAIRIGDSTVFLVDEMPACDALGPKLLKGTPVTIHLFVEKVDASFARAVKAGAKVKMPLQDMFWGDRYGILEDPFGHNWSLATHLRDLTTKQIEAAARDLCR